MVNIIHKKKIRKIKAVKPAKKPSKTKLQKIRSVKHMKQTNIADIFWADHIANKLIERAKKEDRMVVCKCAASPSGGKHIGNMFDVMKAYFIYKAVQKK